jgi:D-serine dehydratase
MRKSALEHNARWMRHLLDKFSAAAGASCHNHHDAASVGAAGGAWLLGTTVATMQQAEVAAAFGCRNVLIANQVTGRSQVRGIVELNHAHAALEIYVLVDSVAGLKALSDDVAAAKTEHPVNVLLEFGFTGGRTGCRTLEEVSQLLDELPSHQGRLRLAGMAGYEGQIVQPNGAEDGPRVEAYFDQFAEAVQLADRRNAFLTDELSSPQRQFLLRHRGPAPARSNCAPIVGSSSGCYVTHCGTYVEHLEQ